MKFSLKARLLTLGLTALLLDLSGCASGPEVRVSQDKTVEFSQFKTYGFVEPLGTDRGGYQSIVSQHLKAATQAEMEARGLRLVSANPQLLINFNASLNEKMRVSSAMPPPPISGYYGYRVGMYSAWPMYADQSRVSSYTEGTLNIDVIDAARKQLIWEGVVTDSVTQKDLDQLQSSINTAVKSAFAKFPLAGPAPSKSP
ncbi:DUF4136 domain-containing protein [Roseateles oligotrophus]|uniref:DUF4136 domain-containing protein n=1 Tax=Roseateles oligotrophus TaxID=1769250 RepID=A0ABT2YFU3_9BURK|nr:DUF4136 domain-containing protein [Roseateles oligotrophus]MCV2368930.1 DUF4136 domain-containing protein [Roseateles oligotrophus]